MQILDKMINLTTNTKSFSVDKGKSGGKSGSSTKVIKQIIYKGGSSGSGGVSGSGSGSGEVFIGATADNPGR